MNLVDMQSEVDQWIARFEEGYWSPLALLARLTEEVGELAREINHRFGEKPKKASEPESDMALEIADIMFVLLCLANSQGINMEKAFQATMEKYRSRDAKRFTLKDPGKW
jgi:NTP pyrophosphatase (non-canonical NTP hydrolase)